MTKVFIIQDLGFGDNGKGATVDYLCSLYPNQRKLIVKCSGASNCGHTIQHAGVRQVCSNYGSGLFHNVDTLITTSNAVVNLNSVEVETERIKEKGLSVPNLVINENVLISTIYHRIFAAHREIKRGGLNHSSTGHGIGETRNYYLKYGQDSIFYRDLNTNDLYNKLYLLRERLLLESYQDSTLCDKLYDVDISGEVDKLSGVAKYRSNNFSNDIYNIKDYDIVIFEGSQGLLLDQFYGFQPYTTWTDTTPRTPLELCRQWGISRENISILGLLRTNTTRHGNGPLPGYSEELTAAFPDETNGYNKYQGAFRVGAFDWSLLEYANDIITNKLHEKLDGVVVSHFDQHQDYLYKTCECNRYGFQGNYNKQEELTYRLNLTEKIEIKYEDYCYTQLIDRIEEELNTKILIKANGPNRDNRYQTEAGTKLFSLAAIELDFWKN